MSLNPYNIVRDASKDLAGNKYGGFVPDPVSSTSSLSAGERFKKAGAGLLNFVTWPFRKGAEIITGVPTTMHRAVSTEDMLPRAQQHARNAVTQAIKSGTTDEAALKRLADTNLRQFMDAQRAARGNAAPALRNFGRSMLGMVPKETSAVSREFVVANRASLGSRAIATPLNLMAKYRNTTRVGVGLLALGGIYKYFSGRDQARAEAEYAANAQQVMALQAQAAAFEAQARQMQGGQGYVGSVTPEEAAFMQSQMRSGGQSGGFAAAEMQRRAAATAAMQAPTAG